MGASGERCLRGRDFLLQGLSRHGDTTQPTKGSPGSRLLVAHGGYSLCHGVFQNRACVVSGEGGTGASGEGGTGASSPGGVSRGWETSSEWQNI